MSLGIIIAVVLIISTALGAAGSSFVGLQSPPVISTDERKLTPDEVREARDLVMRFTERLQTTNDFTPLVEDMFVSEN